MIEKLKDTLAAFIAAHLLPARVRLMAGCLIAHYASDRLMVTNLDSLGALDALRVYAQDHAL